MLSDPEHAVVRSQTRSATIREYWVIAIRLIIAILLLLLIGTLSCSVILSRKATRFARQDLGVEEQLEAEQRLWSLGYWTGVVDGNFDPASRHALVAFQKVEGRKRTGILTVIELTALRNASRPTPRYRGYAHAEIDLMRQVLFLVDESGTINCILPVSTGSGDMYWDHGQLHRAVTPTGTFKVLRKINGWRLSTLGLLYYPSYIMNGIAIHGSLSIPTLPASHGCIRVPMFAAKELSARLPLGLEVVIYADNNNISRGLAIER